MKKVPIQIRLLAEDLEALHLARDIVFKAFDHNIVAGYPLKNTKGDLGYRLYLNTEVEVKE